MEMWHVEALRNYPRGVTNSDFTIVALRLPVKLLPATSGFVKALKNKSWSPNASGITL